MSAPMGEAGALPVTGSGPFTLAIGLIGVVSIAIGAVMRRCARRGDDETPVMIAETGVADLGISSDLSARFARTAH